MTATFYLGTHQTGWLKHAKVPLMISDRRLRERVTLPRAAAPWVLDSGGFTELQMHGRWTVETTDYVARVRRYRDEIGRLQWAAPQDWMCEPIIINGGQVGPVKFVGTHLSVPEHQAHTVANLVQLREMAPDLPFIPVIQGYTLAEYEHCANLYQAAGIDLAREPLVGLGSVCRRQATSEIREIVAAMLARGIAHLHVFGGKTGALQRYGDLIDEGSLDSLGWSYDARRAAKPLMPGCTHQNCANCMPYALDWRSRMILPRLT